jgi:chemotaxis protein CheD
MNFQSSTQSETVDRRVHVVQGEFYVSREADVVITTILGSCVAACIRDPFAGVGGMNHFLLPGERDDSADAQRYGAYAMELLVNSLLQQGADRRRMEAKLFGGGRIAKGLADIGGMNAAFAEEYLAKEGISYAGGSLGGDQARRIQYWPVSGRARQFLLPPQSAPVDLERPVAKPAPAPSGGLELF